MLGCIQMQRRIVQQANFSISETFHFFQKLEISQKQALLLKIWILYVLFRMLQCIQIRKQCKIQNLEFPKYLQFFRKLEITQKQAILLNIATLYVLFITLRCIQI